jgi:hypothetical protein
MEMRAALRREQRRLSGEALTAAITSYDEMIDALRARKAELGLSDAVVDDLTGLPTGYTGKVLGPARVKKMGALSLWLMLEVLAFDMRLDSSVEKAARMQERWEKRSEGQANMNNKAKPLSLRNLAKKNRETFREAGRKGGRARARLQTAEQRRSLARKGGRAFAAKMRQRRRELIARQEQKMQLQSPQI